MDFTRKRQRVERKPELDNLELLYPHNVMVYRLPPTDEIKLQEFEDLALERLKVLRIFEQAQSRNLRFMSEEWKENITAELNREGLKGYLRLCSGGGSGTTATKKEFELQARRKDYISHFILRLAYCRSQDLKRWFVSREMELFRYKFSALTSNDIKHFLEVNKMNYVPLTEEQKDEVKDGLYESTFGQSASKIELLDFYKVDFKEVLDLVRIRRCYLKAGYAYVNMNDFVSIVAAKHQAEIEEGLQSAQKLLPEVETDDRLFYMLKGLHTSYTGKDYTVCKTGGVPIEALDQLSKKSYPLCMRLAHEHLRTHHHHKHMGRITYGLFLKGIGVTLEDSLRFWREEFTRKMDLDKFEKTYGYGVRYNYGKEGSMINYTPYSCLKIITSAVGAGDSHGCPFKVSEQTSLKLKLAGYGVSPAHIQEVVSYINKGHYQIACMRYFEITHDTKLDQGINHPNQYFELSQAIMGNRETKPGTSKGLKKPIKKEMDASTLMNADEDDELWNIAETQASQYSEQATKTAWDDDFDITQVEL